MIDFAKGADILIHEAMLEKGVDFIAKKVIKSKPTIKKHLLKAHTLTKDVGAIASQAKVKHLILNHLLPTPEGDIITKQKFIDEARKTYSGELSVGYDGLQIDL